VVPRVADSDSVAAATSLDQFKGYLRNRLKATK
jgi:hypothetical protein